MGGVNIIRYKLVDRYLGVIFGMDISSMTPGECRVAKSARRLQREQSYGFVHALFGVCLSDDRTAISVTPGAEEVIRELLAHSKLNFKDGFDNNLLKCIEDIVKKAREQMGLPPSAKVSESLIFACNSKPILSNETKKCIRLFDKTVAPAEGLSLPTHCFPDGIVYGFVEDRRVVSVAYAHRSGIMEDQVVDIGVETAEGYRRKGYAKTVVSAVTAHMVQAGGQALYACSPRNFASIATARSVGYELYGRRIHVPAPALDV